MPSPSATFRDARGAVIIQLSLEAPFATESFAFSKDVIFCCDNLRGHKPSRPGLLTRIHLHIKNLTGLVLQASSRMPALNGSWASARGHQRWHCWICSHQVELPRHLPLSLVHALVCLGAQPIKWGSGHAHAFGFKESSALVCQIGFRGLSVSMAQVAPVVHVTMLRPLVEGPLRVAAAGAVSSCQYLPKDPKVESSLTIISIMV